MPLEAVLTCWGNSHAFQERRISVEEPVKVGRSVAQSRPSSNNTIFDCKVLSRNHALIWSENGKFFLQDTKSSNGTFVNNHRLSKGSEESAPREIFSSDILQFGVDVVENSRKVTHSCIIAMVKFYDSDGKEIMKNVIGNESMNVVSNAVQSQEFYQLLQYLQEAMHREQLLESKLAVLRQLVQSTLEVTQCGWQNVINEERLLSKLDVLENQLCVCSKLQPDESLKKELLALQDDKFQYESVAKDSLRTILEEKLEAVERITFLERTLSSKEEECLNLQDLCNSAQSELESLAGKYQGQHQELQETKIKLQELERKKVEEGEEFVREKGVLLKKIEDLGDNLKALQAKIESLQAEKDFSTEQLNNFKAKMDSEKKFQSDSGICGRMEQAVQVDLVNLLDLHLLESAKHDDEEESEDEKCESFSLICDGAEDHKRRKIDEGVAEVPKQALWNVGDQETIKKLQERLNQSESELALQKSNIQNLKGVICDLESELLDYKRLKTEKTCAANVDGEAVSATKESHIPTDPIQTDCRSLSNDQNLHSKDLNENASVSLSPRNETELDHLRVEFEVLKNECLQLRRRIVDVENEVQISHSENSSLKHEYKSLQESYELLEQASKKNGDINATDSQKEVMQSKSELCQKQNEIDQLKVSCAGYDEQVEHLNQQLDLALQDFSTLSQNAQTISLLSFIPLVILMISIVMAFYPFFSSLTATSSPSSF